MRKEVKKQVQELKRKGYSNVVIAHMLKLPESTVRRALEDY